MSETTASLRRKIESASELQSVVRTMKALAASSVGQYEKAVLALADYYRAVELGVGACLQNRESNFIEEVPRQTPNTKVGAVVFGSDQGLVGQFNDTVTDFALEELRKLPVKPLIWAVGARVHARLLTSGITAVETFEVPNSVQAITPLVSRIQIDSARELGDDGLASLYVFRNRPLAGSLYEPIGQRLLPLDREWQEKLESSPWPTPQLPEVLSGPTFTLAALIREYLFISLFRACAESLASENASRLAAMERAEQNINELRDDLSSAFHRLRQAGIDEELFDVIAGYEALTRPT